MKIPGIPTSKLNRFGRTNRALWLVFKVGLPLGVTILVLGTVVACLSNPQHFGNQVPQRVAAVAETILALAFAALTLASILDGYVSVWGFGKSIRFAISGILIHTLVAILLASLAIVLAVFAVRDWL